MQQPSSSETGAVKRSGKRELPPSRLREHRIRRGLTQAALAGMAGLHANSVKNLENGVTREVTPDNAKALAKALKLPVEELGLRVRRAGPPPSVRMRQLMTEQRAIVEELLTLPPEAFAFMREAIRMVREQTERQQAAQGGDAKKGKRR
jgi:transcriptional regulator with XRE-family HTH domain